MESEARQPVATSLEIIFCQHFSCQCVACMLQMYGLRAALRTSLEALRRVTLPGVFH